MLQQLLASDGDTMVEHVLPKSAGAPESVENLVSELGLQERSATEDE